ncbi:ParB/RepB/Spo0J family partition protein [bacterium]|nr:ParB/RepB/Spo0J family partition protein [bacterium]
MTAKQKERLGRGLSALIKDAAVGAEGAIQEIEIAQIKARESQPRRRFEPKALAELVESIKAQGVLQPLLIMPKSGGYDLIAGERRLRAATAAGLFEVPCRILEGLSEQQILEIQLVENLQREDLNPLELADGYRRLIEELGLNQQQVAERVGKDRATVANTIRLLKLPEPVRRHLVEGRLSAGHSRALLSFENDSERIAFANRAVEKKLSVREMEKLAQNARKKQNTPTSPTPTQAEMHSRELANTLESALGVSVSINHSNQGGRIVLRYKNLDELDELVSLLKSSGSR